MNRMHNEWDASLGGDADLGFSKAPSGLLDAREHIIRKHYRFWPCTQATMRAYVPIPSAANEIKKMNEPQASPSPITLTTTYS